MNQAQEAKLDKLIKRIEHQIERAKKHVEAVKKRHASIEANGGTTTEHGGWDLGYRESRLATLEDTRDDLNELKALGNNQVR